MKACTGLFHYRGAKKNEVLLEHTKPLFGKNCKAHHCQRVSGGTKVDLMTSRTIHPYQRIGNTLQSKLMKTKFVYGFFKYPRACEGSIVSQF